MLKLHYCHIGFVDNQHNFDITYLHFNLHRVQKQPPEVFYKSRSEKFHNIRRKTTALKSFLINVAGLRSATLLKKDFNAGAFLWTFLRTPTLKSICERLRLWMSYWNFATTLTFMNKNNYIVLNVKNSGFVTLETHVLYWVSKCKNIAVQDLIARLNFYQLLRNRPIFKTLVFPAIFPFCSICHLFCHVFFYIAVYESVTSHSASKWNHRHNKRK